MTTPNETIYDTEIAPLLSQVAQLCKAHGMPMAAAVYFDGENSELTQVPPTQGARSHPAWLLLFAAWKARGNIDTLCFGLADAVKPENDGSIVLRLIRGR